MDIKGAQAPLAPPSYAYAFLEKNTKAIVHGFCHKTV